MPPPSCVWVRLIICPPFWVKPPLGAPPRVFPPLYRGNILFWRSPPKPPVESPFLVPPMCDPPQGVLRAPPPCCCSLSGSKGESQKPLEKDPLPRAPIQPRVFPHCFGAPGTLSPGFPRISPIFPGFRVEKFGPKGQN